MKHDLETAAGLTAQVAWKKMYLDLAKMMENLMKQLAILMSQVSKLKKQ